MYPKLAEKGIVAEGLKVEIYLGVSVPSEPRWGNQFLRVRDLHDSTLGGGGGVRLLSETAKYE